MLLARLFRRLPASTIGAVCAGVARTAAPTVPLPFTAFSRSLVVSCVNLSNAARTKPDRGERRPQRREVEDDDADEVITSETITTEEGDPNASVQWSWLGDFPREDFSEKTDRVPEGKNWETEPIDRSSFSNYLIPSEYQHMGDCPLNYTHREYIGTGQLRGKRVPGLQKVHMRLRVSDLGLSPAGKKYLIALAGLRYAAGKDELNLATELYPQMEDNVRFLYDQLQRLVDEASKADAIDAAVAAGRDPATDGAVLALDAQITARRAAHKLSLTQELERRTQDQKKQQEDHRATRAAQLRDAIAKKEEAAKLAAAAAEPAAAAVDVAATK